MSYRRANHILLEFFIIGLVLLCWIFPGMAAEKPGQGENGVSEDQTILYETEGDITLGYRWISTDDSLKAAEYIYPHPSLVLGLDFLSLPLPFRYHLNGELASKYDYYLDGGFAYKDIILFRDILTGTHHNLSHFDYKLLHDFYEPPELVYDERDPGGKYYKDFASNLLSLRLKKPDYPLHFFINHRHVKKEGTIQQRFALWDVDAFKKVSESRDIDWKSDAIRLGANSHLGPLELEYDYDQSKFDPGSNYILKSDYDYPDSDPIPDGNYPHNVIPETKSIANTVKVHTSYTGALVAAATVSNLFQRNNYSRAESTTWKGAFDFSWIPDPAIGLFFRYRHIDMDLDTPDTPVGYTGIIPQVRQGVSYSRDVYDFSSRYKPMRRLILNANYNFTHIDREDVEEWTALTDRADIHKVNLTANARPVDKLKVSAKYEYKYYDQPSYNTTPDKSNMLRVVTTYMPTPAINIYLEYILTLTERDSLIYLYGDPALVEEGGERDGQHDRFLASLTAQISPKASLTCSWFYQKWKIEQDLAYGKVNNGGSGIFPFIDAGVPYSDESNTFSLALSYLPWDDLSIAADLSYTTSKGSTGYHELVEGVQLPPLSSYSDLEVSETSFALSIIKKFYKDWEIGLQSNFNIFDDKTSDFLDGNVITSTVQLKRYF